MRSFGKQTTVIYDVSALLWTISWRSNAGNLGDFIIKFKQLLNMALLREMLTGIRAYTNSTKSYMRMFRQEKNCGGRVHILIAEMPLPPKTSILGVTKNKVQLNKMLAGVMMEFIGMPLRDGCTASLLLVPKMSLLK